MHRTIELDDDAYRRLDEARLDEESDSEVIRRCLPHRRSVEDVLAILRRAEFSESTLEAIDESVARRRRTPRRRRG